MLDMITLITGNMIFYEINELYRQWPIYTESHMSVKAEGVNVVVFLIPIE